MRQLAVLPVLLLSLVACSQQERPEGVVERWLVSLNQGPAGEPGLWAEERATREVTSWFDNSEPGQLDSIVIGQVFNVTDGGRLVQFSITTIDGETRSGEALLVHRSGEEGSTRIITAANPTDAAVTSSGWSGNASTGSWLLALLLGAALAAAAVGLVMLVKRGAEA
jgi:hypothetical protein